MMLRARLRAMCSEASQLADCERGAPLEARRCSFWVKTLQQEGLVDDGKGGTRCCLLARHQVFDR